MPPKNFLYDQEWYALANSGQMRSMFDRLRAQIDTLKAEVATLKEENSRLRVERIQLESMRRAPAVPQPTRPAAPPVHAPEPIQEAKAENPEDLDDSVKRFGLLELD